MTRQGEIRYRRQAEGSVFLHYRRRGVKEERRSREVIQLVKKRGLVSDFVQWRPLKQGFGCGGTV